MNTNGARKRTFDGAVMVNRYLTTKRKEEPVA
jgi:hypothetical protein